MAKKRNNEIPTNDSYENMTARLGVRAPNQSSGGTYSANYLSRNRLLMEQSYRSSWLVGAAVDAIADDMTRKGISITSKMEPSQKQRIDTAWEDLSLWDSLNDVIKWSRLYGGAIGLIMIEGQSPQYPLRMETIGKGAFKGVMVLDRWMIRPTLERRVKDLGPDFGRPEYYEVVNTSTGIPAWKIHHSRVIRFDGVTLPFQQALIENDWGMSVIERIFDRLLAFDSATTGAAQLVFKAHLRTYSIADLRKILAMGGPALNGLMQHMDMIRQYQSIEGMTIMDATDKFESHSYTFAGLSDVIAQFGEQVSGATGIPLVRLFGQSPAGFSTGDTDLANYYDGVGTQQERRLRRPIQKIMSALHMSELGTPLPDDFAFEFNPLWQMSEVDRSTVAANTVNALTAAVDSGIMTQYAASEQLRDSSRVTGIGSTISDEDLENVKDIDPPSPETAEPAETETGGDPLPNSATKDSASGGRHSKWSLRWFKR